MYDILSSHFADAIQDLYDRSIHRNLARLAYLPKIAPVEYVFNQIKQALQVRMHEIHDGPQLMAAVRSIIANLSDEQISATSTHCGYQ
jgi:hypothetical protein